MAGTLRMLSPTPALSSSPLHSSPAGPPHTYTRPHTNTQGWKAGNALIPSPVGPGKLQTLCAVTPIPVDAWLPLVYTGRCRTNGFTYQTLCVIRAALGPPHKSSGRAALEPVVGGFTPREKALKPESRADLSAFVWWCVSLG